MIYTKRIIQKKIGWAGKAAVFPAQVREVMNKFSFLPSQSVDKIFHLWIKKGLKV